MAARPPQAVLKKFAPSKEAADVAVKEAAGTSVTVPGGATVQHAKEKGAKAGGSGSSTSKELAVASSVDVTSGAELSAALSAGEVQAVADALIAVVAEQAPPPAPKGLPGKSNVTVSLVNEAVADAVTEVILTTREPATAAAAPEGGNGEKSALSRLEALGVAFGAALRRQPCHSMRIDGSMRVERRMRGASRSVSPWITSVGMAIPGKRSNVPLQARMPCSCAA